MVLMVSYQALRGGCYGGERYRVHGDMNVSFRALPSRLIMRWMGPICGA